MALYRVTSGDAHTVIADSEEEAQAIVNVALGYAGIDYYDGEGFNLSDASLDTVESDEVHSYTERIAD